MDSGSYIRRVLLSCLFSTILTTLVHSSGAQQKSEESQGEVTALIAFQTAADRRGRLQSTTTGGWNHNSPTACEWHGIKCNSRGRVYQVDMSSANLEGTFEENTLSRLTELEMLNLSNNLFRGSFPRDLSHLTGLVHFEAQNSTFSGPFPNIANNLSGLVQLSLSGNNLAGSIPDLSGLVNLATLDLSDNSFEGEIPVLPVSLIALDLSGNTFSGQSPKLVKHVAGLALLDLSDNQLTGPIPDVSGLNHLMKLDLSDNSFEGQIPPLPASLAALNLSSNYFSGPFPNISEKDISLAVLDLSGNGFRGTIPYLSVLNYLTTLDLRDNFFTGSIPSNLADKFPYSSFVGNALCGPPTNHTCLSAEFASSRSLHVARSVSLAELDTAPSGGGANPVLNTEAIVLITVGSAAVLAVTIYLVVYLLRRRRRIANRRRSGKAGTEGRPIPMTAMGEFEKTKLSFIDSGQHGYDLEDLLRASAEMLGKGSFGTAYKAVMENGMIVAVKRLRDVRDIGRKEFDQHMETLGRLQHPNLVPLRAYYYAKEEKLLIYDFMPNGSLFSLLHGTRGPGRTPLEWPARLSIAQGVAQGLTYLHREGESLKLPHGNLKSSNILLGKNFEICISDFGLVPLMPTQFAVQRMAGYRAPEYNYAKKITYKADVYSFGVLLMELLTGQQPAQSMSDNGLDLPKWVQSVVREEWTGEVFDLELKAYLHGEEEMVTLLQIAMSCVDPKPDLRPDMASVVEQLDDIRRGDSTGLESPYDRSYTTDVDYSKDDFSKDDHSRDDSSSRGGTPDHIV